MVERAGVIGLSLASVLLLGVSTTAQVVFPASDVSGAFESPNGGELTLPSLRSSSSGSDVLITRPDVEGKGHLLRMCDCSNNQPAVDEIRGLSDKWLSGGVRPTSHGFSNLVWSWGQFIDHDIVATVDGTDETHEVDIIVLSKRGMTAEMRLHPLISREDGTGTDSCPSPVVVNTPIVDAGTVYSNEDSFLKTVLRMPNSCMLRTSGDENMLPISTVKNSDGNFVFVAGDARVDEHAVLTMMHTVWMREHNRLCDFMNKNSEFSGLSNDQKFEKARNVVIAKIQDITVREWLPLLGISESDLRSAKAKVQKPDISIEFSTAAYRFGHDMVPDFLGPFETVKLFNGNAFFGIQDTGEGSMAASFKLDDVALFAAQSRANELDGKFSDTLRNTLFGSFGEDLGSRNLYRGRDMRIADYGMLADCFKVNTADQIDETVPPFIGLLRDNKAPSKDVFGPVQRAILVEQFHRIFFGTGGDWWETRMSDVSGFEDEIHKATMGSVLNDNTRSFVQSNAFKVGSGGKKQAPYGSTGGGSGDGNGGDSDDDTGPFQGFPDFPDNFPEF